MASFDKLQGTFLDYQSSERRAISASISGAVIENVLDITHPMSFGLGAVYYSLKTDDRYYSLLKKATNVAYVPQL
jgi:hypothetical protein